MRIHYMVDDHSLCRVKSKTITSYRSLVDCKKCNEILSFLPVPPKLRGKKKYIKLDDQVIVDIWEEWKKGINNTYRELSAKFGVTESQVKRSIELNLSR